MISILSDKKIIKELYKLLLREQEMNLRVRGGRGYGVGHPYTEKKPRPGYGYEEMEATDVENVDMTPVKVSRAFKERKNEVD